MRKITASLPEPNGATLYAAYIAHGDELRYASSTDLERYIKERLLRLLGNTYAEKYITYDMSEWEENDE